MRYKLASSMRFEKIVQPLSHSIRTVGGAVGFEEGDAVGIFCVIRMQQLGYKDSERHKKEMKRSMHIDL